MFHLHIHVGGSGGSGEVSAQKIGDGQLLKAILEILIQLGVIKLPIPTGTAPSPTP